MISMSTSHISPTANLGDNVVIGQFCVVGDNVSIGNGCVLGNHVVLHDGTRIGDNVRIDDHAVIGKLPMKSVASATTKSQTSLAGSEIGAGCIIGTGTVVYRGATLGMNVLAADYATIREDVSIGDRTIVGRGVAIENQSSVGASCKLETNCYITAYSEIEDQVFVAPGVLTSNDNFMGRTEERFKHFKGVTVRRGGRLGVGAVILPGKVIASEAVVAAGAILTRDAEDENIYLGIPARVMKPVPDEQKLSDR